jgi:hypothetical protein
MKRKIIQTSKEYFEDKWQHVNFIREENGEITIEAIKEELCEQRKPFHQDIQTK